MSHDPYERMNRILYPVSTHPNWTAAYKAAEARAWLGVGVLEFQHPGERFPVFAGNFDEGAEWILGGDGAERPDEVLERIYYKDYGLGHLVKTRESTGLVVGPEGRTQPK